MDIWNFDELYRLIVWFTIFGFGPYAYFLYQTQIGRHKRRKRLNERRGLGKQYYSDRTEYYIVNGRNVDLREDSPRDMAQAAIECADSNIKELNRLWQKKPPTHDTEWFWFIAFFSSLGMAIDPTSPFQFAGWIWYGWCLFKAVEVWDFNLLEDQYRESWEKWDEVFSAFDFYQISVSDDQHLVRLKDTAATWKFHSADKEQPAGRITRKGGEGFVDLENDHHWNDDGHPIWQMDH